MKQKNTHKSSWLSTRAEIQLIACFSKIIKKEATVHTPPFSHQCALPVKVSFRKNFKGFFLVLGRPQLHDGGVFQQRGLCSLRSLTPSRPSMPLPPRTHGPTNHDQPQQQRVRKPIYDFGCGLFRFGKF